ncbi:DUF302 domain-containing protein [Amycolatopsis sp. OK19-0408]|uniref:DUF302 domain-containing protein n=1 Tax=Amycolatopsis iheyensis TaxID=2945988 RepID=A0A9X2NE72_9PSEU|nr:DUF302 domain-containing protein [Amycolatopsis iheyensis]MCR6482910.1 DUF302 domain-containing protein [Amycolatopsis iheyensis]
MDEQGLTTVASQWPAATTVERLEAAVAAAGLTVFARVDHARNAREVGLPLRPTFLLVFGNPRGGTLLMQDNQVAGIDLPLKFLVWADEDDQAWVTYDRVEWIAGRHGLSEKTADVVATTAAALDRLARHATGD